MGEPHADRSAISGASSRTTASHAGLRLLAVVGVLSTILAAATIWLLVAHPVAVVDALATGELSPLMQAVAAALASALRDLVAYLA